MRRVEVDYKVIMPLMGGLSVNGHDIGSVEYVSNKIQDLVIEELKRLKYKNSSVRISIQIEHSES